jgi:hypothetical protein
MKKIFYFVAVCAFAVSCAKKDDSSSEGQPSNPNVIIPGNVNPGVQYACGITTCQSGIQYCLKKVYNGSAAYECRALPGIQTQQYQIQPYPNGYPNQYPNQYPNGYPQQGNISCQSMGQVLFQDVSYAYPNHFVKLECSQDYYTGGIKVRASNDFFN